VVGPCADVCIAEIADVRPLHRSYASSDWKDGPLHPPLASKGSGYRDQPSTTSEHCTREPPILPPALSFFRS
jgi:hypothetical protein